MKQFSFYADKVTEILNLSNEDAGKLFKAVLLHAGKNKVEVVGPIKPLFDAIAKLNSSDIESRKILFKKKLWALFPNEDLNLLKEFSDHWTEHNENGRKMRFEMEKVFNIPKRMATWKKNNKKYSKPGSSAEAVSIDTKMTQ